MARTVLVDAGFLVALLGKTDSYRMWATAQAESYPPPWLTCEAVLSEVYHMVTQFGVATLAEMLRRRALIVDFVLAEHLESVLTLIDKYANVPMALADACLVRMTEILQDPVVLATDADFRLYRRHSRQIVPCVLPD
jgi:uncharacterized protein